LFRQTKVPPPATGNHGTPARTGVYFGVYSVFEKAIPQCR